ncbi:hypothetical protein RFX30_00485, partial [Acinetobacter baumannii]|nr:hypothetical protein [Acinetobacter baumannii]
DLKVLLSDLRDSVDFVNEDLDEASKLIVEKGFMGNEAVAKAAIPNCHIVLFDGDEAAEGMEMLKTLNKTLFDMDPKTIGGK